MLNSFKEHIETKGLFTHQDKLLVAVSGGVDSMVLCHLLTASGYDYEVTHVNHSTRNGESDNDEDFVVSYFSALGIPVHVKTLEQEYTGNFHDWAHKQRYKYWKELSSDFILTAHHKDDHVETILLNVINGRSAEGILLQSNKTVRPLLLFSKSEIQAYAQANAIKYVEDSSNDSRQYLRNVIRHDVIPALTQVSDLSNKLEGFSRRIAADNALLINLISDMQLLQRRANGAVTISVSALSNKSATFVYHLLSQFGVTRDLAAEIAAGLDAVGNMYFTADYQILVDREVVIIKSKAVLKASSISVDLNTLPTRIAYKGYRIAFSRVSKLPDKITKENAYFPESKLKEKMLIIDSWKEGDYFYPFGLSGHKQTLKKLFADNKIDRFSKSETPILRCGKDILWVVGLRTDERYRVYDEDDKLIKVELL